MSEQALENRAKELGRRRRRRQAIWSSLVAAVMVLVVAIYSGFSLSGVIASILGTLVVSFLLRNHLC